MPDEVRRETPDVATQAVLVVALGFLAFVALSLVALRGYYAWSVREPVVSPPRAFAEPRLQSDPRADLARLRAEQTGRLQGYAWVDRERGVARIPIERAMALLADQGQAAYAPLDPPPAEERRR
jgi:hypothetical protein